MRSRAQKCRLEKNLIKTKVVAESIQFVVDSGAEVASGATTGDEVHVTSVLHTSP